MEQLKQKVKAGYVVFVVCCLALCLIPSLGMLLHREEAAGGNQVLSRLPSLTDREGNWNPDYLTELAAYGEDHAFLKQEAITAWSALNARVLGSSVAEDVVLGRDGWLYYGGTLADYTGAAPLDDRALWRAAHNLSLVQEYCQGQGADFLFTLAPNKNSLYSQWMPPMRRAGTESDAKRLMGELERQGVCYLDLFDTFSQEEEVLYFAQDSHWNSKGAALAADAVIAALGGESRYYAGPFTRERSHQGDLYAMLYPTGKGLEEDMVYGGALAFNYDAPIRGADAVTIMTTGTGEGSLLAFRDSFGNSLYPYLADHYASALFSRAAEWRLELIAEREADAVVVELVERNIGNLLKNLPNMPAPLRPAAAEAGGTGAVQGTAQPCDALPGYVTVTGSLPEDAAGEGPVYLAGAEGWYEAFLLEDGGFGLHVPETVLAQDGLKAIYAGEDDGSLSVPFQLQ